MTVKDEITPNREIQNLINASVQISVFTGLRLPLHIAMRQAVSRRLGNAVQHELGCLP